MLAIVSALLRCLFSWLRPKHELVLENLALRHQIAVLNRPAHKPRLQGKDRLFWVVLKGWWPNWRAALIILQPETVIGWQRAGFRMFWRWKSRPRGGRPRKDSALIQLIRRMWAGLAWSCDATEYGEDGIQIIPVQDRASRYRFRPLVADQLDGCQIATHLPDLFRQHGAPLFLKRDNGSSFNHQDVDEVLTRFGVLPLNNPPHFPR